MSSYVRIADVKHVMRELAAKQDSCRQRFKAGGGSYYDGASDAYDFAEQMLADLLEDEE